ncbi:MAG: PASTA domain-containing protein [Melioribacteraceae bacterium]|nr:PASTA domain-containing protein [Melioribacteraceae bacterium]
MPWYVYAPEVKVPNIVGKHKSEAARILENNKFIPVEEGAKYDSKFPKDYVIFQKPGGNSIVKEGRRVYYFISGGNALVKLPNVVGKTLRDAKITLERVGMEIGDTIKVRSEFPADLVVEQSPRAGIEIPKGTTISLKVSVGPQIGMIRVPNLIAKSVTAAERILRENSLKLGKKIYQPSSNLLPNTIIDQIPTQGKLVSVGDSVDVVITKSVSR